MLWNGKTYYVNALSPMAVTLICMDNPLIALQSANAPLSPSHLCALAPKQPFLKVGFSGFHWGIAEI
jgi:hypothetical protein